MYAAKYGHTDVVKLLRNAGANTEIEDKTGCKPIDYAAKYGHTDVVKILRNPGGNTEIKDKTGCKAIDYASYYELFKRMDLLRPTSSQGVIKATTGRESLRTTEDRAPRNLSTFNFKLPQTESSEDLSKAVAESTSQMANDVS